MKVNGKMVELDKRMSLHDFLSLQDYNFGIIVVERNGEIIPKTSYKDIILNDDDTLEIVTFVGGG